MSRELQLNAPWCRASGIDFEDLIPRTYQNHQNAIYTIWRSHNSYVENDVIIIYSSSV